MNERPASLSSKVAWLRHLRRRRGQKIVVQALRMYRFHRTPFERIIDNILEVIQKQGASFTFPTVASVGLQKPELLRRIVQSGSEIASHGYVHLKYPLISAKDQEADVVRALSTFQRMGIQIRGFRAPYNAYDKNTPRIIDRLGLLWDGGIGHSEENRTKMDLFRVKIEGRDSSFVCVPLNEWSDDSMIDERNYSNEQILEVLKHAVDRARQNKGLVMFDLHPIRMGQKDHIAVLDELVSYGKNVGGWFPTVSEAVDHRLRHGDWAGQEFCCLLTGDIDNFYFRDYLRRLF